MARRCDGARPSLNAMVGAGNRRSTTGAARTALGLVVTLAALASLAAPTAAAPHRPTGPDRALAASAILQLSDFPAGWTTVPRTDNATADRIRGRLPDCRRYQQLIVALRKQPEATDNFLQGSTSVSSTVFVLSSSRVAQSTLVQLTSASVQRCLQRFLGVVIPSSFFIRGTPARLQSAAVQPISVAHTGDQTVGFRVAVTLNAAGVTVPVYEDVVVARVGRGVADLGFENPGTPLSQPLRDSLLNAVAARLADVH